MIESKGMKRSLPVDYRVARLYYPDGQIVHFVDPQLAYAVWLDLPKGIHAAFRGANDTRLVYPWDYADAS